MAKMRFIVSVLLLFPGAVVTAEPGFWAIDSIDVPMNIQQNGDSVYQIIVMANTPEQVLGKGEYESLFSKERDLLEADVRKPPTETPEGNLGSYYQVQSCMSSEGDSCEIYAVVAMATAFEGGFQPNVSGLWASYSTIKDALHNERGGENTLNILLVDRNKNVVFDTRGQGQSAKIMELDPDLNVVQIKLSQTIGRPLLFGELEGMVGGNLEDIFILGFPIAQREETTKEDFYASSLQRYDLAVTIGEILADPMHGRGQQEEMRIQCDADSAPGMTGAPALNERGEVIGILSKPTKYKVGSILTPSSQIFQRFSEVAR